LEVNEEPFQGSDARTTHPRVKTLRFVELSFQDIQSVAELSSNYAFQVQNGRLQAGN
jgi:hypothetical protein